MPVLDDPADSQVTSRDGTHIGHWPTAPRIGHRPTAPRIGHRPTATRIGHQTGGHGRPLVVVHGLLGDHTPDGVLAFHHERA